MTYRQLKDLYKLHKINEQEIEKRAKLKALKNQISDLEKSLIPLKQEIASIEKTYKGEYGEIYPFDDVAILTIVDRQKEQGEVHILAIEDGLMKCSTYFRYSQMNFEIPYDEFIKNGYYILDDTWFVATCGDDEKTFMALLDWLLKHEKLEVETNITKYKKWIEEYKEKIKTLEQELLKFENYPDSDIAKIYNQVSFGITKLKQAQILEKLPRKMVIK
jgi:hypothetical protein